MGTSRFSTCALLFGAFVAVACGGSDDDETSPPSEGPPGSIPPKEHPTQPGTAVALSPSAEVATQFAELRGAVDEASAMTSDAFLSAHAVTHRQSLGYDPKSATGLDLVQGSQLALSEEELAVLGDKGFVISAAHEFPTFTYGYQTLYMLDLPLYISADSILDAVHRSYDDILEAIEMAGLIPELRDLLVAMRNRLPTASGIEQARADADLYLAVALGLLEGRAVEPVAGADASQIAEAVSDATKASGWLKREIFGVKREIDFSQFTPRGHYTDWPELERYFRAMMWLGRTDFRLIETLSDGRQVFHRRQFNAMLALYSLMDSNTRARHQAIDSTIETFVGESDNMSVAEVAPLLEDLGVSSVGEVEALSDQVIAEAIIAGNYGAQRIASQIIINLTEDELPLSRTFVLFGQRYVVDSHVFSNVTWARTDAMRMMPDPLDVAFGALANDHAAQLLEPELVRYAYAPNLEQTRVLVDAHGDGYWDSNLYTGWLGALRTLSPSGDVSDPAAVGMPAVTGTEAWTRRILNTQLASWAQLRHDTILYAKQSYTDGAACEFPDAYVEPYPEFFAALRGLAANGQEAAAAMSARDEALGARVSAYFGNLDSVAATLGEMADAERLGQPFTTEQMAFVNRTVNTVSSGCVADGSEGWYSDLFFNNGASIEWDPTIADVHTQPTDESGNPVGRVLHVGTGRARTMTVTVDTCIGPHAYVGLASSYYEATTEDFDRLDDARWAERVQQAPPEAPEWIGDVIVGD